MTRTRRGSQVLGAKAKDAGMQLKAKAIAEYWPRVERLWQERFGPRAIDLARDDDRIADLARDSTQSCQPHCASSSVNPTS